VKGENNMQVLVLNGSPEKEKSITLILTKLFLQGLNEEAEIINLYDLKINPCTGCYACWFATDGHCVQKDDAIQVLEKIRKSDLVIWSVPLYCYGAPSQCKALADRTVCFNKAEMYLEDDGNVHHFGYEDGSKKAVLISTAGLPKREGNFDGLVFQMRHMFGSKTPAICCAESALFMQDSTAALVEPYKAAVLKAGEEYKTSGRISEETQKKLDALIIQPEDYVQNINAMFAMIKKNVKDGKGRGK
jgi:multimeric flavodoxin WrbA